MKQIDGVLFVILGILAGVAFLNFGKLNFQSTPAGVGFGGGFQRQ